MVDLRERVQVAVFQGLTPIEARLTQLKDKDALKAWGAFTQGPTKKLLGGDITVDEWRESFGVFCQGVAQTKIPTPALQGIVADADGAVVLVEEAFNPPSPMRWLLWGGVAATAIAWWWMRRDEKQEKLLVATPSTITGTPRAKRPVIDIETIETEIEEV